MGPRLAHARGAPQPDLPHDPTPFSATDASGDTVGNAGTLAYLSVPAPGSPTIVSASQTGASLQVSWTPAPANPNVITSSTVTATPEGSSASPVSVTVTGPGTGALVGPLQPATAYDVTVTSTTIGGSSAPSAPLTVTTEAASVAPGAPTGVAARWTAEGSPSDTLLATWSAPASTGDSAIDAYEVQVVGSDAGGTFSPTVSGTTLAATFAVSDVPDWSVTVRAHNAAGWGPSSTSFLLGGA